MDGKYSPDEATFISSWAHSESLWHLWNISPMLSWWSIWSMSDRLLKPLVVRAWEIKQPALSWPCFILQSILHTCCGFRSDTDQVPVINYSDFGGAIVLIFMIFVVPMKTWHFTVEIKWYFQGHWYDFMKRGRWALVNNERRQRRSYTVSQWRGKNQSLA
jgi:hypothetical protein